MGESVYRMGVDIGGTFTDFALYDESARAVSIHKRLTTPEDPARAVIEGVESLLAGAAVAAADVDAVVHGTTLVTNAVIERRGAKTGMLVTAGFSDLLDMGLETRYDLFDLRLAFPEPLVPRALRREVDERVRHDGTVELPLDRARALAAAASLVEDEGVEALAVCFLHAYANPEHEEALGAALAHGFPDLAVSCSAAVLPCMREYERWTTTTMNAYVQPMFGRYLDRLVAGLGGIGFAGRLFIMTSSGGMLTPETARRFPVRALESGPAAGVLMAALHGRALEVPELLSFDMGGTTAKGALVRGHTPVRKYEMEVARVHGFKRGSGLPVRVPAIDMIEIGAGGGSIAELDERGVIAVGPRSAGADPGPACYGRGGTRPTLTDANLLLGYLDPAFFLGGEMALDLAAAERAVGGLASDLGVEPVRAAFGVHETINEDIARAFRVHAAERGFDTRAAAVVAFGGSGPVHALNVARKLRAPKAVFPVGAGVMSAFGLLASPLSFEIARSYRVVLEDIDAAGFAATIRALEAEAAGFLLAAGVAPAAIGARRVLNMRFRGQGHEIEVALPEGHELEAAFAELPALFRRAYSEVFASSPLAEALEIVNWKVEARGPSSGLSADYRVLAPPGVAAVEDACKGVRPAYVAAEGGFRNCPVYDRYGLRPGMSVEGPALIEERESTCVLGAGDRVALDRHDNLIAELRYDEERPK